MRTVTGTATATATAFDRCPDGRWLTDDNDDVSGLNDDLHVDDDHNNDDESWFTVWPAPCWRACRRGQRARLLEHHDTGRSDEHRNASRERRCQVGAHRSRLDQLRAERG